MARRFTTALVFAFSLLAHSLAAAGLEEGRDAFDKRQFVEARKELTLLAEASQPEAMAYMGEMLMRGLGGSRDELKARDYITRAQAGGSVRATYQLGLMTLSGNGVTRDAAKGVELVKQAADQAYPPAQSLLGIWIATGAQGYPKDEAVALSWFNQAADKKDPNAFYWLGQFAEFGLGGVPQDNLQALDQYKHAGELAHAEAMASVGRLYALGKGVAADGPEALKWLQRGVTSGSTSAYLWMGSVYEFGRGGLSRNPALAHAWYQVMPTRAPAATLKMATEGKERLSKTMSAQELAEADKLAKTVVAQTVVSTLPGMMGNAGTPAANRRGVYGSGVVVSAAGDIVSNEHVINNCARIRVQPGSLPAKLVAKDAKNDLALLRLEGNALAPVRLRSGRGLRLGDDVVAIGYPLRGVLSSGPIVTMGIVNAMSGSNNDTSAFQMSATVQPGSSGGPIFDRSGLLVGIVRARLLSTNAANAQNVNFGINLATVQGFLDAHSVDYALLTPPASAPAAVGDMVATAQKAAVQIECY